MTQLAVRAQQRHIELGLRDVDAQWEKVHNSGSE
jgi:hypothetical protein